MLFAAFDATPEPFIGLMVLGFLVGAAGHVYRSQTTVIVGIGFIFMATLGLPLVIYLGGD